ncbi:MAG: site-2 protease family protein [Pirellulaceae bacterium]
MGTAGGYEVGLHLIATVDLETLLGYAETLLGYAWMIGTVATGLGFVIFVHELGHFLVAKACGVKCEKFYLGFDIPISMGPLRLPSRFCRFQWGETEYGVGILPLGGYVKMLGQDDNPGNAEAEAERIRIRKNEKTTSKENHPDSPDADGTQAVERRNDQVDAVNGEGEFELDPRSFPAKPVPYRMAIISAGVIMNLIFAVIFASLAFRGGVPYMPCEIGGTVPGSPAWRAGLEKGSRVIQLGTRGHTSEHLRFDWDLRNAVGMSGGKEEIATRVRKPDGEEYDLSLRPMVTKLAGHEMPMLGIEPAITRKLNASQPTLEGFPAAKSQPPLEGGDRIVAVNGETIPDGYHLKRVLSDQVGEDLQLTVEREREDSDARTTRTETIKVTVPTNHLRRLGLIMSTGPVNGVYPGSPAADAGFRDGDVIVSVAGEPLGDPMCLPDRLRPFYGREIEVAVRRQQSDGSRHEETLTVTPQPPSGYESIFTVGSPMAVRSLGLVFQIIPEIAAVVPGSPADWARLKSGDEIVSVAFPSVNPNHKSSELINKGKPLEINEHTITWPFIFDRMQSLGPDICVKINYRNGARSGTAIMRPVKTETVYADRGFVFSALNETRRVASWKEAIVLGFRQTREDMIRVLSFLKKLVTGGISPTNLGGPISIAAVAGSEVSKGIPRLLMFLTFLSANLAVLNFLPIPALDGGHMLFLLAEGVRGKPVDERMQVALTLAGVACLLGLMIFVFALDIGRFFL